MVSRVFRATPPNEPAEGEGRIKAFSCTDNLSSEFYRREYSFGAFTRRVYSQYGQLMAFFYQIHAERIYGSAFPSTGTPVIPKRIAFPEYGRHFSIMA